MKRKKAMFIVDPTNHKKLLEIMKSYGNSEYPYEGHNEDGEEVEIHVSPDSIIVLTYQKNRWIRKDVYTNVDGDIDINNDWVGKW